MHWLPKAPELAAVLFNEELGAVIQVHQDATPEVLAQFSAAGLGDCVDGDRSAGEQQR